MNLTIQLTCFNSRHKCKEFVSYSDGIKIDFIILIQASRKRMMGGFDVLESKMIC